MIDSFRFPRDKPIEDRRYRLWIRESNETASLSSQDHILAMASNSLNGTVVPSSTGEPVNLAASTTISTTMTSAKAFDNKIDPIETTAHSPSPIAAPSSTLGSGVVPISFPPLDTAPVQTAKAGPPPGKAPVPAPPPSSTQSSNAPPTQVSGAPFSTSMAVSQPASSQGLQFTSPTSPPPPVPAPTTSSTSAGQSSSASQSDRALSIFQSGSSSPVPSVLSIPTISSSPDVPSSFPMATAGSSISATTSSQAAIATSPPAQNSSCSGSSCNASSPNIALIAAPIVVGAGLVPVFLFFFCWWKRRRAFRGAYHQRNRSSDTEMSNMSNDAHQSSHEPKFLPRERGMSASFLPTLPSIRQEPSEGKTSPVESTFAPGILPGITPSSPSGSSYSSPPPYRRSDRRSDSPSVLLPEPVEPLDVTRAAKAERNTRRPPSLQRHPSSKRHGSVTADDIDWPLPSPFRDLSPKEDVPEVPTLRAIGVERQASLLKEPADWPLPAPPALARSDRRATGSSSSWRQSHHSSHRESGTRQPTESPFDDNADDNSSEYSVPVGAEYRPSSMLNVPEQKHINDDGISEMTVSSTESNRKSRLHERELDEISDVSSLNEADEVPSLHEAKLVRRSMSPASPV
jgi:hypothetical protein